MNETQGDLFQDLPLTDPHKFSNNSFQKQEVIKRGYLFLTLTFFSKNLKNY
jgi:hypothetical protein